MRSVGFLVFKHRSFFKILKEPCGRRYLGPHTEISALVHGDICARIRRYLRRWVQYRTVSRPILPDVCPVICFGFVGLFRKNVYLCAVLRKDRWRYRLRQVNVWLPDRAAFTLDELRIPHLPESRRRGFNTSYNNEKITFFR